MTTQVLVVTIGTDRVALPIDSVNSLVEIGVITPAPRAPQHILGLAAVRSKAFTVVDPLRALGLPGLASGDAASAPAHGLALAIAADNCHYALLVSSVQGVTDCLGEPAETKIPLRHFWPEVALGEVTTEAGTLLLIDPAAIIAGCGDKPDANVGPLRHGDEHRLEPTAQPSGAL